MDSPEIVFMHSINNAAMPASAQPPSARPDPQQALAKQGGGTIFGAAAYTYNLSASLGVPGQTGHKEVYDAAAHVVRTAKAHGKLTAAGIAPQDLPFWTAQRMDLLYCINDIAAMKAGARQALDTALGLRGFSL